MENTTNDVDIVDGSMQATPAAPAKSDEECLKEIMALVEFVAKNLVDDISAVSVSSSVVDGSTVIALTVAESDMGKVIGKQGRIAKAIRSIVKASAIKQGKHYVLDIMR